jgi:hypothetical protein
MRKSYRTVHEKLRGKKSLRAPLSEEDQNVMMDIREVRYRMEWAGPVACFCDYDLQDFKNEV